MKKRTGLLSVFLLALILGVALDGTPSASREQARGVAPTSRMPLAAAPEFGNIPLYFVPCLAQTGSPALFSARTPTYTLWLTRDSLVFDAGRRIGRNRRPFEPGSPAKEPPPGSADGQRHMDRDITLLTFLGANEDPRVTPSGTTDHRVNSFVGRDPARWRLNVAASKAVRYEGLYQDIDLEVYGIEKAVEYDWVVKPGGDPAAIGFDYEGAAATRIDERGDLVITTRFGDLIHRKPVAYQVRDGRRVAVDAGFRTLGKDAYGFRVGAYRRDLDLIIDPLVLVYSTYLGGTCSDDVSGIAVDAAGCAYVTGMTTHGDFPIKGAY